MNPKELTQFRSQNCGFRISKIQLIQFECIENVSIAMESTKMNRQERRSRAAELLKEVGLGKRMSHLPDNFQVVNSSEFPLQVSIMNHPKIIYADEPTGSLDSDEQDNHPTV